MTCLATSASLSFSQTCLRHRILVVEIVDRTEIASFVSHDVFKLDLDSNATNIVDAAWVRKWENRGRTSLLFARFSSCSNAFGGQALFYAVVSLAPAWHDDLGPASGLDFGSLRHFYGVSPGIDV